MTGDDGDRLPPDEVLAAIAYVEAAFRGDRDAQRALVHRDEDERPMPVVLAAFAQQVISALMDTVHGVGDDLSPPELAAARARREADVTVRVSAVLSATLAAWAAGSDERASDAMAHSVIAYVQAVGAAPNDDVLPLLARLRAAALRAAGRS
ncbi:hypothetical protein [Streptomyces chumphonensis]|uniref:hypothetical protein n=1 Tax=Streptomyces chumphonensis TaxID=1214925 RepID=UPI003D742348